MVNATTRFNLNRYEYGETWDDPDASGVSSGSPDGHTDTVEHVDTHTLKATDATTDYTASNYDAVLADNSAGAFNVTLPAVSDDVLVAVKKTDASANATTIQTPGSETIDGSASLTVDAEDAAVLIAANATNYHLVGVRVGAGDGLKGGDGSNLDIEPADFAGVGLEDDGADNLRLAASGAGDGLKGGSGVAYAVEPADFAGAGLIDDGSDNLAAHNVTEQSTDYTASENDVVLADASAGPVLVTLPAASTDIDVTVKKLDSTVNNVSIQTPGAETIDGLSDLNISTQYASRSIVANASEYFIR